MRKGETTAGLRTCGACGTACYHEDQYCPNCGRGLSGFCQACGAAVEHPIARFCTSCGSKFARSTNVIPSVLLLSFFVLLFGGTGFFAPNLQAQNPNPVTVTTNVLPPYDPDLSVWERNPNRLLVTLVNTDPSNTYLVRLGGFIESDDGGVKIEIKNTFPATPITLPPGATKTINARGTGLLDPNAVTVTGADRDQIARTRRLPEGSYRACLQALDNNTLAPLSIGAPTGCATFNIQEGDLPRPFFPTCGESVAVSPIQTVNIQWTRPVVTSGGVLQYELVIVPVEEGKSPEESILSATDPIFFQKKSIPTNYYQYGPIDPKLEEEQLYAWRVRAVEVTGNVSFPNDGWSEVCSFRYGDTTETVNLGDCDPPAVNSTFPITPASTPNNLVPIFPYRNVPFMVRYSPLCATLKTFTSDLSVKDSTGGNVESWNRSFTYDATLYDEVVEKAQEDGDDLPEQKDVVNQKNTERHTPFFIARPPVAGSRSLPAGKPLSWSAQIIMTNEAGSSWTRRVEGKVQVGMGKPILSGPPADARTPLPISFSFQTSARTPANKIVPADDAVYKAEELRGYGIDSVGVVKEVWMLEVSPTPFTGRDTIVFRKTGKLAATIPLTSTVEASTTTSAGTETNVILNRIYKTITVPSTGFNPTGGDYYWRVKWLSDNDTNRTRNPEVIADTAAYAWSEVRHFVVDTTADTVVSGIDSNECIRIKPVLPTNGSDWKEDLRPQFAVSIEPAIDITKVTGVQLDVWRLDTEAEQKDPKSALLWKSDLTWNSTGSSALKARPAAPVPTGGTAPPTIYDLDLVNLPTSAKEWIAGRDSNYAWRVTLRYKWNGKTIRTDSVECGKDSTVSSLATFRVYPLLPSIPDSVCILMAPHTPIHNEKITTTLPVFSVKVTPPIDSAAVAWVELRVWKMNSKTESPAAVTRRVPTFKHFMPVNGRMGPRVSSTYRRGDLASILTIHEVNDTTDRRSPAKRFIPSIDSSYLWQVSIAQKVGGRIRIDSVVCTNNTDSLRSAYGVFRYDTTRADTVRACPDSCSFPTPVNRTLRDRDFKEDDTVRIGRFTLSLTSLDDASPSGLSGEGEIAVGWLKMSVEVEFSGLQVNTLGQVISGLVRAKQSKSITMPAETMNSAGASPWTQEGVLAGYGAATAAARMANSLLGGGAVSMPIGFEASLGDEAGEPTPGSGIAIGITDMTFTPEGANLTALAKMPLPFMGKDRGLGFGVRNLCFTPKSFTSGVEKNVFLAADAGFRDGDKWGFKVLAPTTESGVTTDSGTYITWDCHGIAAFRVAAAVEFPRTMMLPINAEGTVEQDSTVLATATASFLWRRPDPIRADSIKKAKEATVSSTTVLRKNSGADTTTSKMTKNGFHVLASGKITRFAPTNTPDLQIEVANITFDWSDFENPAGMVFPTNYTGDMTNMWRGFYLRGAYVRLPNAMTSRDSATKPLAIEAEYLMVDRSGLSFRARMDNLLPIDKGRASGWALGIEKTTLEVVNNVPRELSLAGEVRVPIFKSQNNAMRDSLGSTLSGTRDTGIYRNTTGIGYDATLQYIRQLRPDSGTVASSRSGADTSKYVSMPKFSLTLNTRDNLMMPMWSAKASLGGNVTVSIEKRWLPPSTKTTTSTTPKVPKLGWVAGLKLSASLNFGADTTKISSDASGTTVSKDSTPENSATKPPSMNFAGIGVQGLHLESVKPYLISFGTWTIGGVQVSSGTTDPESSSSSSTSSATTTPEPPTTGDKPQPAMEGFPLSISNIEPATSTNDAGETTMGLTFDINLHLMPTANAGFSSATTLGLFGKMSEDTTEGQKLEFSHFELKKIAVDAMFGPAVRLKGVVQFYRNDKVYGSGFYGAVDATILEKINAQLVAQFGTVEVGPDSANMRKHRYGLVDFAAKFTPGIPLGTTGVSFYGAGGGVWFGMGRTGAGPAMPLQSSNDVSNFKIGQSLSGYIYKPDTATLFGARIMATLGASDANAFNADIALEIEVTPSFGLGRVTLQGKGYGLSTKFPDRSDSRLNATVDITFRPPSMEFHGLFAMSLIQEPAIAVNGQVVVHFDPKKWYVKFGEPSNRINAKLGFLASVSAYFMFGDDLPPPPDPPGSITANLGKVAADRDFAVTKGEGIALGAQASFDTGEKTFLIFYGKVKAILGFDASILKYPDDLACGTYRPVGMNSWYATLQMYAELDAEIGIKAKIGFSTIKAEIFKAQAWALLKAGAPNPTWAAGKIAGKYNVLGGLVKGNFNFEFDVGSKCTPGSSVLGDIKLITDVAPATGDEDVDPAVSPQATFGMAVNTEFSTTLAGQKGTFRLLLDRFLVQRKSGNSWITLSSNSSLDNAKTTATAYPRDMLNAQTDHRLVVTVRMQKKGRSSWSDFWVDGNRVVEERQIIFKSGDLPETIPAGNVAYTWPIQGQRFFMKSEGTRYGNHTGRIVLKQGQSYLFQKNPKATSLATWVEVRSNDGADVRTYTASYSSSNREVTFRIPGNLHNGKIYKVNLIRKEVFPAKESETKEEEKQLYGKLPEETYRKAYNETYNKEYNSLYSQYLVQYRRQYGSSWYGRMRASSAARSRAMREAIAKAKIAGTTAQSTATGATASTTDRTLSATKSSGRVDEKVISNYAFGTSAYSTYGSKMANSSVESDTRYTYTTSIWVRHSSEGFDAFDVAGFSYSRDGKSQKVAPRYRANSTDNSRSWHTAMIENQLKQKKRDWESWFPSLKGSWYCGSAENWACRDWYWNKRHAYVAETSNVAPLMSDYDVRYNRLGTSYDQRKINVVQTQGQNARTDYSMMKRVEGKWWFKATKTTTKVVSEIVTKTVTYFVDVYYKVTYWVSSIVSWFKCKVLGKKSYCGYNKTEERKKSEKRSKQVSERVNKTITETLTIPTPRWIGQYGGSYTMTLEWDSGSKSYTFTR